MQIIVLIYSFDLEWPEFVLEYFNKTRSVADGGAAQLLSLECLMDKSSSDYVYFKLVIV